MTRSFYKNFTQLGAWLRKTFSPATIFLGSTSSNRGEEKCEDVRLGLV